MTLDDYNAFCAALPHSAHVVQWGGAHVWKIGGKVYVMGRATNDGYLESASFKVSPIGFEVLKEQPGLQGAPYLASRGMKWIQRYSAESMSDAELLTYIEDSYRIIASGLTKKLQRELGLL